MTGSALQTALDEILAWLSRWASTALMSVAALVLLATVWRLINRARFQAQARVVTIEAPPQVDPAGAITFWANMIGLLRPWWIRPGGGQPGTRRPAGHVPP